jgi:hypothetical protein
MANTKTLTNDEAAALREILCKAGPSKLGDLCAQAVINRVTLLKASAGLPVIYGSLCAIRDFIEACGSAEHTPTES